MLTTIVSVITIIRPCDHTALLLDPCRVLLMKFTSPYGDPERNRVQQDTHVCSLRRLLLSRTIYLIRFKKPASPEDTRLYWPNSAVHYGTIFFSQPTNFGCSALRRNGDRKQKQHGLRMATRTLSSFVECFRNSPGPGPRSLNRKFCTLEPCKQAWRSL